MKQFPRLRLLVLFVILLFGFGLRVYGLSYQSYWRDEVDTIRTAQQSLAALFPLFLRPGFNGPLYMLLIHFWIALSGTSEFAVRFLSVFCGVVALALLFRLARTLRFDIPISILATALSAIAPFYVWYSQEARMYMLALVLSLGSVLMFVRGIRRARWIDWAFYLLLTAAALYSHILAALILPAELALAALYWSLMKWEARRQVTIFAGALLILAIPIAIWAIPILVNPPAPRYPFLPLPILLLSTLRGFSVALDSDLLPWGILPFGFLLTITAALPLARWWNKRQTRGHWDRGKGTRKKAARVPVRSLLDRQSLPIALAWAFLGVPLLIFFLVTLRFPLFTERYLIFISPAFFILSAAGVFAFARWRPAAVLVLAATLLPLLAADLYQVTTPIKPDLRQAADYIASRAAASDTILFVMPAIKPTFDFYYHRQYTAAATPPVLKSSQEQFSAEMTKFVGNHPRGWVVLSEAWHWDPYGAIPNLLSTHASGTQVQQLQGVDILAFQNN